MLESFALLHSKSVTLHRHCAGYWRTRQFSFLQFWKMKLPAITLEGYKYYEKRRLAYRDRTPNPGLGAELGNVQ